MKARLEGVHPVLGASDVAKSIVFYQGLGFVHVFSDTPREPRYAAVQRDGVELHLQWRNARDWLPGDRSVHRFFVPAVEELFAEFAARAPALDRTALLDTPRGTREFHVRDPDGNGLQSCRPL